MELLHGITKKTYSKQAMFCSKRRRLLNVINCNSQYINNTFSMKRKLHNENAKQLTYSKI